MRSQPRPVPTVRWAVLALVAQLVCVLMLALSGPAWAKPEFPALTGRVVDQANILPPETEQQLEVRLAALEASTPDKDQLVVVTVADLGGYEIADYGYQLGRHWAIGQKDKDNGVLLIVAPNDRKVRVEVGYGLEPVITDAVSSLIIQNKIVPKFKA
ncbi:MAG: TPM domain-containing protein, partial [Asticcacaulis sp.]